MEQGRVKITYYVPTSLEVDMSQVIAGQAIIGHVEHNVTHSTRAEVLPEEFRADFKAGNLMVLSTDLDALVLVKLR